MENKNNYVKPDKVDLNNVSTDNASNILNRERENIVKATIVSNDSINQEQASKVNNEIKIKKINPFVKFISFVFVVILAVALSYFVYRLSYDYLEKSDELPTTTTQTTRNKRSAIINYLNNDKVKKFMYDNKIIIISPKINNKNYYLLLEKDNNKYVNKGSGEVIINDKVNLVQNNITFDITENGITENNTTYNVFDGEIKSYSNDFTFLIINGTIDGAYAMVIENNSLKVYNVEETDSEIKLSNGNVYVKDGLDISNNGVKLSYNR